MNPELFKSVVGFEGLYAVNRFGVIKSLDRVILGKKKQTVKARVIAQQDNGHGYKTVRLWKGNKEKSAYVHRIVLIAFTGREMKLLDACHGDGNRANNELANLRWDTRSNNHRDKLAHGTMANGEKAHTAKLTAEKVLEIRSRLSCGSPQKDVAQLFGISQRTVGDIKSRRTWKHI